MFPTGTVSFLFTDIQGSTHLWEQAPLAMKLALERHNAILRVAIEAHGGVVFKVIGDAFQAAFSEPFQALAAAVQAQHALQSETWGEIGPIGVRMGIHSGPAELHGDDYAVSHTLNRVARIASAGCAGQVLLSLAATELVREELPQGVSLRDLGEHILKGMARPEHIFQAVVAGLPQDFPPLASSGRPSNNLPVQLTLFIGREKELGSIARKLQGARLVTLTGSGGVGKTRLAIEAANRMLGNYPDGVWLVELGPLSNPHLVPQSLAAALNLRDEPGRPALHSLVEALREKRMLIILDNCEHLVEASASLVEALLAECPNLQFLASSREALGVEGEAVAPVPSLSHPGEEFISRREVHYQPENLLGYEAVQLFLARAQAVEPEFRLDKSNSDGVVSICQRLDGIPLAIELAAARVRVLGIDQIAERLGNVFRLLTGGSRSAVPRHQTLWATIDWSHALLSEAERVLFRRLAVFVGGWTMEAAEAVCANSTGDAQGVILHPADILDLLTQLTNKSLVLIDRNKAPATRYRFLETVRQYGREKLSESGEADACRRRHRDWYVEWVESGVEKQRSADFVDWMDQLESDFDNLRAAQDWSRSCQEGEETILRLSSGLYRYWWVRGNLSEAMEWVKRGLELPNDRPDLKLARARALYIAAWIANSVGLENERSQYLQDCVDLYRELESAGAVGLVEALGLQAMLNSTEISLAESRALVEQGEALGRQLGAPARWSLAMALWSKSLIARFQKDIEAARRAAEESWALFQQVGDLWNAGPLMLLGIIELQQKDYTAARNYFEGALLSFAEAMDRGGMGSAYGNLTILAIDQGDFRQASLYFREGARIWQEVGSLWYLSGYLESALFFSIENLLTVQMIIGPDVLRKYVNVWGRVVADQSEMSGLLDSQTFSEWWLTFAERYRRDREIPYPDEQKEAYRAGLSRLFEQVTNLEFNQWVAEGALLTLDEALNIAVSSFVEGR
jgi:predicted ATPase/class 3 adenylate cyclase